MDRKILLIGYGNPGRGDDGLGPSFVRALAALGLNGLETDADYQLTVEDAAAVAASDLVVFVDAAVAGAEPFAFKEVAGEKTSSFSTHAISPGQVVALAEELFARRPSAYMLSIRGYRFNEYIEELSPKAETNLRVALEFYAALHRRLVVAGDLAAAVGKQEIR